MPGSPLEPRQSRGVDQQLLDTLKASADFLYKQGVGDGAAAVDEAARLLSQPTAFDPDWCVHPGGTLRDWREENGLPASTAAMACGRMDPETFERIEAGKRRITRTLAAQLQAGTDIPASLWLNLERAFRAGLKAGKTWTP